MDLNKNHEKEGQGANSDFQDMIHVEMLSISLKDRVSKNWSISEDEWNKLIIEKLHPNRTPMAMELKEAQKLHVYSIREKFNGINARIKLNRRFLNQADAGMGLGSI